MRVILLRHGIAVDRMDPRCPPDPERPLTPQGRRRTRAVARGLSSVGIRPGAVLASPYVRAVQTAEIVCRVLGGVEPEVTETLLPGANPADLARLLRQRPEAEVLCTGHEPHLGLTLARLVLGRGAGRAAFAFKKAGAACVETEKPGLTAGELAWLLPPRILRRLGIQG